MKKCLYRPLEVEGHSDGGAVGDGSRFGSHHSGLPRAEGAGRLGGDYVLRVLETDAEKDVAVAGSPAEAARGAKRVHLQLKHSRRGNLQKEEAANNRLLLKCY